ncbi:zinc-binding dehydrogenase [Treponema sp. J25]|uniref:zinc-binding dehydrogenase n=1 Tax=Treponema sp. J25 TaxID=2094121 RepID=UPI00104A2F75|nr:zinc-binding dehydrogenase [Treponema sp. J25]TCW60927.1 L-sorbose 1-phosphate reductase [Treponema sp. J25]
MKTKAVRLYGKMDLRLEEFELPEIKDDEILVKIISDSICMSTYKAAKLGSDHKRVPKNIDKEPVIVGHETAGIIEKVGKKWQGKYTVGAKFALQPALNYKGSMDSPGYSYRYCGGDATYAIMPQEVMELDCLLDYRGEAFFMASLAEPMSCIIGAFHASYHTTMGSYEHRMGTLPGGTMAILAGAGPMGLGAVSYALQMEQHPRRLVVTDIDEGRLARAAALFPPEEQKRRGVELLFINTAVLSDPVARLIEINGGTGYDDVFVFAPVAPVVEQGDAILGKDGCLNFFAGPVDTAFSAKVNFYNVHYGATHIVGTTGGNTDDMREALLLSEQGRINPAVMVTHVGGLDSAAEATLHLPDRPAGKKLVYTQISMPMTAIADFAELGKTDGRFAQLAALCNKHRELWNAEAERYLLANWPAI